jgi:aminomethyltransferase
MPVQYTSILEEHAAVRKAAGLFDVSHMGEFHVTGHQAAAFLDKLLVNSIAAAPIGKAIYSPMCQRDGGVVDDLIVYRTDPEAFLICVNASNVEKDYGWLHQQAERWGMEVEIQDHSENYALLAVQGPKAATVLEAAGFESAGQLKRFTHEAVAFMGEKCRIARTGYTGEDGFELYVPISAALELAERLVEAGQAHGLQLCGLGARDSLRLEAGLPLYGHELSDTISPLEAGLGWTVKFGKEDFIGKNALSEQQHEGLPRQLIHFKLEGRRIAREGTAVVNADGASVGQVLSGTKSPLLDCPIGSALIDSEALQGTLAVDLRGHVLPLQRLTPPLHQS